MACRNDVSRQTPWLSTPLITTRKVSVSFHQREVLPPGLAIRIVYVGATTTWTAKKKTLSSSMGASGSQQDATIVRFYTVWWYTVWWYTVRWYTVVGHTVSLRGAWIVLRSAYTADY